MRPASIALLLAMSAPSLPASAAADTLVSPTLHFTGGQWFDGRQFKKAEWYSVGGRLTARRPKRVDVTFNLSGSYVLLPFAEAHNHDIQNAYFGAIAPPRYLRQGIFYSAQLCADTKRTKDFSGQFNRPNSLDVVWATACVTASDGHPLGLMIHDAKQLGMDASVDELRSLSGAFYVDSLADLDREWERIAATKTPLVKLILVNSEDYAANRAKRDLFGKNGLDPALAPEIVRRAHAAGMRAVAHVDTAADFATAIRAGTDIIAHLPGYRFTPDKQASDYRISDDAIREAARRKTVVIATAVASRHHVKRRPEVAEALRQTQVDNLRRLIAAGVPIATGSDLVGDGSVIDELEFLDRLAVMPRAALLRSATMQTPRLLFPERRIGEFSEGAEASFITLDANPLRDFAAIRRVRIRVKQGNLLAP